MVKVCYLCKRTFEKASKRSYHLFPQNNLAERKEWFRILGMELVLTRHIYLCSDHFTESEFYYQPSGRRTLKKGAKPNYVPPLSMAIDAIEVSSSSAPSSTCNELVNGTYMEPVTQQVESESEISIEMDPLSTPSEAIVESQTQGSETGETDFTILLSPSPTSTTQSVESGEFQLEQSGAPLEKRIKITEREIEEDQISNESIYTIESNKRRTPRYYGDCVFEEMESPSRAKQNWHIARHTIAEQRKKIKTLQQQTRRLQIKVNYYESLIKYLSARNMITIDASVPESSAESIRRLLKGPTPQNLRQICEFLL